MKLKLLLQISVLFVYVTINGMMQPQKIQSDNRVYYQQNNNVKKKIYEIRVTKPDGRGYEIVPLKRKKGTEEIIALCCAPILCIACPCLYLLQCIKNWQNDIP